MKRLTKVLSLIFLGLGLLCSSHQSAVTASSREITVHYEFGTDLSPTGHANIYAIWIQNKNASFIQNVKVCKRLLDGSLTNTALPFWKTNVYPSSSKPELDAVTSATQKNVDFTITAAVKDTSIRNFTVFFEIDRSFEPNDWFTNQPAVLYSADINFDDSITSYELIPAGWTPNEGTKNIIPNTEMGILQTEMKYITHHKAGTGFGDADPRSLTSIVNRITVSHQDFSVKTMVQKVTHTLRSLSFNVVYNCLTILSNDFISKVVISNVQGETVHVANPVKKQTSIDLSKHNIGNGLYIITATIGKTISSDKLLIMNTY